MCGPSSIGSASCLHRWLALADRCRLRSRHSEEFAMSQQSQRVAIITGAYRGIGARFRPPTVTAVELPYTPRPWRVV